MNKLLFLFAITFVSTTAHAADFTVTNIGDGAANCPSAAGCTLRVAILQAIASPALNATVKFDPSLNGKTITLTQGAIAITDHMSIIGPGASQLTINGNGQRIFTIGAVTVTISGLTLTGGNDPQGGAINNSGVLTVDSCTLRDNKASTATGDGGAIANLSPGTLNLTNSMVTLNTAGRDGGGIYSSGTLKVGSSSISRNSAITKGGGIYCENGAKLVVSQSSVSRNTSEDRAGGMFSDGVTTIDSSTLDNNSSVNEGGAIANHDTGTMTIVNSTIDGNWSDKAGGGVHSGGILNVQNSTVSSNFAKLGGGLYLNANGTLSIANSIVATNSVASGNPDISLEAVPPAVGSQGYNLIGNGDFLGGFLASDQVGTTATLLDPKLGPLVDNGGPTLTRALKTGSPAINKGNPNFDTTSTQFDQRGSGFPRVAEGRLDVGAFELQNSAALQLVCPSDVTIAVAAGAINGPATYTAPSLSDSSGNPATVTCDPAPGVLVGIGPTKVTCTATDAFGANLGSCTFNVIVSVPGAAATTGCNAGGTSGSSPEILLLFVFLATFALWRNRHVGVVVIVLFASMAQATATFQITTAADDTTSDCLNGNPCSLRGAIAQAIASSDPDTVIVFSSANFSPNFSFSLNLNPALGSIFITQRVANSNLTILGTDQNSVELNIGFGTLNNLRIFSILGDNTFSVRIYNLTLFNGGGTDTDGLIPNGLGGAIYNAGANLTVENCSITNSHAGVPASNNLSRGGAIYSTGALNVIRSTLSGNSVSATAPSATSTNTAEGGAIYTTSTAPLTLLETTISGNTATAFGGTQDISIGGAIFANTNVTINTSTITLNSAADLGGIDFNGSLSNGGFIVNNSIIAGNIATFPGNSPDIESVSLGSCSPVGSVLNPCNVIGINPGLNDLAFNGSLRQTHSLKATSPALGTGDPTRLGADVLDERDFARLRSGTTGKLDIGAYENQRPIARCPTAPNSVVVNAAPGTCLGTLPSQVVLLSKIDGGSSDPDLLDVLMSNVTSSSTSFSAPSAGNLTGKTTANFTLLVTDPDLISDSCSVNDTVQVNDLEFPTIVCPTIADVEAVNPAGVVVNYTVPTGADFCGVQTVICSPVSGSTFTLGTEKTVSCIATDYSNHSTSCTTNSFAVKSEAFPILDCSRSSATVFASGDATLVTPVLPTVTNDANDPNVTVVCNNPAAFPLGDTPVHCIATNSLGETGFCDFTITVVSAPPLPVTGCNCDNDASGASATLSGNAVAMLALFATLWMWRNRRRRS